MRTRKRFGQHFLEPAWADKVIDAIGPAASDVFLEIGPGPGILTLRLAPRVAALTAIEIDRDLIAALTPKLPPNASMVSGDVLEMDLESIAAGAAGESPIRVAGNLPYNISSPILFRLLDLQKRHAVRDATLMLQREVAQRIIAKPATPEYGVLSVLVQRRADVARLLTLPPGAFRPPPAVNSAVVRLAFRPPVVPVVNEPLFERMVRSMFTQRRKVLANSLAAFAAEIGLPVRAALHRAGIDSGRRAETLEIVETARLADVFATAER